MSMSYKYVDTIVTVWSILFVNSVQETVSPCSYVNSNANTVFISALLPVHDGPNCTHIQLRGIQQMAVLTNVINKVNNNLSSQEGLTLDLDIHDTCSTPEGAVKAALRALVENGQTCQRPPLFLGFVGLEDSPSLLATKVVTKMFNISHIIPYVLANNKLFPDQMQNVIHVARQNYKQQTKSILAIVQQLHWNAISLVFEDSLEPLVEVIIEAIKESSSLCIIGTATRLTQDKIHDNIFTEAEGNSDGTIVVLNTPDMALRLFQIQHSGNISLPILISINKVGLHAWQISHSFSNVFLLQQTSTSIDNFQETMEPTLFEQYNIQENSKCTVTKNTSFCEIYQSSNRKLSNSVDASVTAISHAIQLLGSALRVAHRVQCRKLGEEVAMPGLCQRLKKMNTAEWQEFFKRSSSFARSIDNPTTVGIHFDVELPIHYDLYVLNPIYAKLEKIGKVRKGNLINTSGFVFPTNQHETKCPSFSQDLQLITKITAPQGAYNTTLLDHFNSYKEYSKYQLIGLLCGVGVGMLLFMVIIVFGVYNMFRVRSNRSGRSSSVNTSPRIRRQHRGSIISNRSV